MVRWCITLLPIRSSAAKLAMSDSGCESEMLMRLRILGQTALPRLDGAFMVGMTH